MNTEAILKLLLTDEVTVTREEAAAFIIECGDQPHSLIFTLRGGSVTICEQDPYAHMGEDL